MRNSYPTFRHEFSYVNFTDIYFSFKISIMPGYQLTIFQLGKLRKMTSKYFIAVTPKYFHNKLPVSMFFSIQLQSAVQGWGQGVIFLVNLYLVKLQEDLTMNSGEDICGWLVRCCSSELWGLRCSSCRNFSFNDPLSPLSPPLMLDHNLCRLS